MEKVYIKIISAALILCGCSDNPVSPQNEIGPIIFASNRDGVKRQIYAMNEDGSNITRITRSNFNNDNPRWSKDGQSIVYVQVDSSTTTFSVTNVYIMNRDGSGKRNVTNSETISAINPVWSPDGTKIIFINWEGQDQSGVRKYNIYSINIDGTEKIQITKESDQVQASGLDWR